jgi:hypothetical protein
MFAELARHGLNHIGVVGRARYDQVAPHPFKSGDLHPGTESIVVVGSGGRDHWQRFLEYIAEDPVTRLARTSHPLDDFCRAVFPPLEGCRVVFPSLLGFDFMKLATLSGLGAPSHLGTLVSARFGPWFGLRAAIFTPETLPESAPQSSLCDGCPAPCDAACPVAAAAASFDWRRCVDERLRPGSGCRGRCYARLACIVAPEEAYDDLELVYHYDRPEGRRRLCAKFKITDEAGPG